MLQETWDRAEAAGSGLFMIQGSGSLAPVLEESTQGVNMRGLIRVDIMGGTYGAGP